MTTCPRCSNTTASVSGLGTAIWCSACDYYADGDQSQPDLPPGVTFEEMLTLDPPPDERQGCPYKNCGFKGTPDEVDDHRMTGVHNDQPQAGSNL